MSTRRAAERDDELRSLAQTMTIIRDGERSMAQELLATQGFAVYAVRPGMPMACRSMPAFVALQRGATTHPDAHAYVPPPEPRPQPRSLTGTAGPDRRLPRRQGPPRDGPRTDRQPEVRPAPRRTGGGR